MNNSLDGEYGGYETEKKKRGFLPENVKKGLSFLSPVFKGVFVFLAFSLMQNLCYFNELQSLEEMSMGISNLQLYIVLFEHLFSAMLVYSLERVFTIHDRKTAEKYLASEARGKKLPQRFLFLVKQKKGWIGIAVFAFLILVTPFGFHFNLFYRAKEFLTGTFMKWIIGFETPVTLGLLLLACF